MTYPPHAHSFSGPALPTTPAHEARRTVPAITVGSIAAELHDRYPEDVPAAHALKLVQQALENRGYTNIGSDAAVWSSSREQILEAFRVHYES